MTYQFWQLIDHSRISIRSYLKHWFHFSSWSPEDIIIQEYASTYRLMIIQFSLVCFRAQNWYKTCIINYKVNISYTWFSNSSSTLFLWWISLFVGQKHNRNFCRGRGRCKSWLHNERRLCKLQIQDWKHSCWITRENRGLQGKEERNFQIWWHWICIFCIIIFFKHIRGFNIMILWTQFSIKHKQVLIFSSQNFKERL